MTDWTAALEALGRLRGRALVITGTNYHLDLDTIEHALRRGASSGRTSPSDRAVEAAQKIERALYEVRRLCQPGTRWQMTIPVDLERDSDVILTGALVAAREVLAVDAVPPDGLRAALEPFANMLGDTLEHYVRGAADTLPVTWQFDAHHTGPSLTLADLRRAKAAFATAPAGDVPKETPHES